MAGKGGKYRKVDRKKWEASWKRIEDAKNKTNLTLQKGD